MKHKVLVAFNQKALAKAVKDLQDYKMYLRLKRIEFVNALAQIGYDTAESNVNGFNGITFEIRDTDNLNVVLVGFSERQLKTWWNKREGQVTNYDYSPILMAEFGSGKFAVNPQGLIDGHLEVGRGTFPTDSKNGLKDKWSYKESEDAKPIWTSGERPTKPMLRASQEMMKSIESVARQVFGS